MIQPLAVCEINWAKVSTFSHNAPAEECSLTCMIKLLYCGWKHAGFFREDLLMGCWGEGKVGPLSQQTF